MPAQPCGRFEWERIVRRIVMPERVKLVALLLATFADGDGSRVRPGLEQLTAMTGRSRATVKRSMTVLRGELELLEEVSRGGGRYGKGHATEYRLVIPEDLLDRVELISPESSNTGTGLTVVSPQAAATGLALVSSQSHLQAVDNSTTGLTQDEPSESRSGFYEGSFSGGPDSMRAHSGHIEGSPRVSHYQYKTNHIKMTTTDPDPAQPPQGDGAGKCIHKLSAGVNSDGKPSCPFCRRVIQEAS